MSHTSTLFLAVDPGAGNTKLFSQHCEPVMIRSLVKFGTAQDFIGDYESIAADVLHYIDGSNENLRDQYWIAGGSVLDRNLKPDTPYEDASIKLSNALPLFLTALIREAKIPAGETNIVLVVSSHNPIALGAQLKAEFEGWHHIVCDNKTYKLQVKIPKSGVIAEGSAIAEGIEFATLDIGFLTTLVTPRSRDGLALVGQTSKSAFGVGDLANRIANNPALQSMLGGLPGNTITVSNGIIEASETGNKKVLYRGGGKCLNVTEVYTECLKEWIPDAIGPALKALAEKNGSNYRVIAIGGGVSIPKIAGFLTKRGIELYEGNPILANAESMYANRLLKLMGSDLQEPVEKFDFEAFDAAAKRSTTPKKPKATKPAPKAEPKELAIA